MEWICLFDVRLRNGMRCNRGMDLPSRRPQFQRMPFALAAMLNVDDRDLCLPRFFEQATYVGEQRIALLNRIVPGEHANLYIDNQ
jgi:hypothetical protein